MSFEQAYLGLLERVLEFGSIRPSRAGNTCSLFGECLQIRDLLDGKFPLLTTRKIFYKPVLGELAAFLQGAEDLGVFKKFGCNYWDANAADWPGNNRLAPHEYRVGRIYGAQWRGWGSRRDVDQLHDLVVGINENPYGRRHIVSAWNPAELDDMCLPPCHIMFQCYVNDDELDMCVYMRSVDLCLGLPSDIVLYAALLILLAADTNLKPGALTFMLGDTHVYQNHVPVLQEQLERTPGTLPTWHLWGQHPEHGFIDTFHPDMLSIINYNPQGALSYEFNA